MWTTIGARLLNLFLRNLVCVGTLKSFRFLVGGGCDTTLEAGLLVWWFCGFSVDSWVAVGARLLIYREMMCMRVPVILPIILSAVDMVLVYRLACGVGL